MPDLSVLFPGRIAAGSTGWIQGAPELAIEVVSSESAARLEKKDRALSCAWRQICLGGLSRSSASFAFIDANRRIEEISPMIEPLTDPAVLPGFSIPTSAIFEGV